MPITPITAAHFYGARNVAPTSDAAARHLAALFIEAQGAINTNESDIATNAGDIFALQGAVAGLTSPLLLKGAIAAAASFPTAALVQTGWFYLITAAVTDNDGTKTNTGQTFRAGDEIAWNGTNWTVLGAGATPQFTSVTFAGVVDHGNSGVVATIAWANGQQHKLTLTGTCVLTLTNPPGPASFLLETVQGGIGGFGLTWPAATRFAGGVAPVPTAAVGAVDLWSVYFNGASYYVGHALADAKVAP